MSKPVTPKPAKRVGHNGAAFDRIGPSSIAALVPRAAHAAFAKAIPGVAGMLHAWPAIVGPAFAEVTIPRRLVQGSLTIGCTGPVALELQHQTNQLLGRVNQYLGNHAVHRLRFVQVHAILRTVPPKPRAMPSPETRHAAAAAVADLPDGPLKDALATFGQAVLTESASRLGNQPRTRC